MNVLLGFGKNQPEIIVIINLDNRSILYQYFKQDGVGAEIGVCKGANASTLLRITRPKKLHLVDVWVRDPLTEIHHSEDLHYNDWESDIRNLFNNEIKDNIVILHKIAGIEFLNSIDDNYLDWVYLDSDHSYENISQELSLSILKVKKGGIIAGHDFMVHEEAWKSGVVRAVIEEIQRGTIQMCFITDEKYPSYLCYVK